MSLEMMGIALIVLLLVLLALGLEIAWAIGITAAIGMVFVIDEPINQLAWETWGSVNSFTLLAAPLFVLMGSILSNTGISEYLFDGVNKWIGRAPGGLAASVIGGSAIFGAMCGSSMASAATFGKIAFPSMENRGYDPKLALGSICTGGILSPLIPPSILLIIFGSWQRVSIVKLFAGAIVPGVILTVLLILYIVIRVKINPGLAPAPEKYSWKERFLSLGRIAPLLLIIVGTLGVIFGGIMTASEAGSMGAFLSIVVALGYRQLSWSILMKSLLDTVRVTAFAFFIMAMAIALTHVFTVLGIITPLSDTVVNLPIGKWSIFVLLLVMYFILGMFFDSWSMLFLTFPFVMPVILALGFNPIWWAIVYLLAAEQGAVTPPFGLNLFVLSSVVPNHSMGTIARGSLPYLIPVYVNILLLALFPELVLWLPGLLSAR